MRVIGLIGAALSGFVTAVLLYALCCVVFMVSCG